MWVALVADAVCIGRDIREAGLALREWGGMKIGSSTGNVSKGKNVFLGLPLVTE